MVTNKYKGIDWEEKKQRINDLTATMEKQIQNHFQSADQLKEYLDFMGKFHEYSVNNSLLIHGQFRGARAVGSFLFWKDKGFSVKKGEKGIQIYVPKTVTYFQRGEDMVQLKLATQEEKQKIKNKQIQTHQRLFFDIGHVFDISQTNATLADLPKIFPNRWLEGSVENYDTMFRALERVASEQGIKIIEPRTELGAAKGVSYTLTREVALNPRNSELQNVKTLAHELAHAVLHTAETSQNYTKQEKEFQAEMVAYTVSSYFGLDTSDYSLPYLHYWTNGKELKNQQCLLDEVRTTAHNFVAIIEDELVKERGYIQLDQEKKSSNMSQVSYEKVSNTKKPITQKRKRILQELER